MKQELSLVLNKKEAGTPITVAERLKVLKQRVIQHPGTARLARIREVLNQLRERCDTLAPLFQQEFSTQLHASGGGNISDQTYTYTLELRRQWPSKAEQVALFHSFSIAEAELVGMAGRPGKAQTEFVRVGLFDPLAVNRLLDATEERIYKRLESFLLQE